MQVWQWQFSYSITSWLHGFRWDSYINTVKNVMFSIYRIADFFFFIYQYLFLQIYIFFFYYSFFILPPRQSKRSGTKYAGVCSCVGSSSGSCVWHFSPNWISSKMLRWSSSLLASWINQTSTMSTSLVFTLVEEVCACTHTECIKTMWILECVAVHTHSYMYPVVPQQAAEPLKLCIRSVTVHDLYTKIFSTLFFFFFRMLRHAVPLLFH